jgi:hypothetical protein
VKQVFDPPHFRDQFYYMYLCYISISHNQSLASFQEPWRYLLTTPKLNYISLIKTYFRAKIESKEYKARIFVCVDKVRIYFQTSKWQGSNWRFGEFYRIYIAYKSVNFGLKMEEISSIQLICRLEKSASEFTISLLFKPFCSISCNIKILLFWTLFGLQKVILTYTLVYAVFKTFDLCNFKLCCNLLWAV